jgi:hypothetical protein
MRVFAGFVISLALSGQAHALGELERKPDVWHAIKCIAHLNKAVDSGAAPSFLSFLKSDSFDGEELAFWNTAAARLTQDWGTGFDDEVEEQETMIDLGERVELDSIFKGVELTTSDPNAELSYIIPNSTYVTTIANPAELCMHEARALIDARDTG